jgi:hypothetical protein
MGRGSAEGMASRSDRKRRDAGAAPPRPRRRRRRRILAISALVTVLVLAGLFFLAPVIAGRVVPGAVQRALNGSIQGTAAVQGASFSWWGRQSIGPITVTDRAGRPVGTLHAEVSRGLLSLISSAIGKEPDFGRIRVSGSLQVVRTRDGELNIAEVFRPRSATPSAGPGQVPPISAQVVLDALDLTFVDEARIATGLHGGVIHAAGVTGQLSITGGRSGMLNLALPLRVASAPGMTESPGGAVTILAQVDGFADAAGNLIPEQAAADLHAELKDVAPMVADTLAAMDSRLAAALGDAVQGDLRVRGTLKNSEGSLRFASAGANADLTFGTDAGVLSLKKPGTVSIEGPAIAAVTPQVGELLERHREEIRVDAVPGVKLSVERLRLPVMNVKGLDLREAAIDATVETTALSGRVVAPGAEGQVRQMRPFEVSPVRLSIASARVQDGVSIKGHTETVIDGQPSGAVNLDVRAGGLLDEVTGNPRPAIPRTLAATLALDNLATAIAEPLVQELGVKLSEDVGPTVTLILRAATAEAPAAEPGEAVEAGPAHGPASIPPTTLTVDLRAANLQTLANLSYDGRVLRSGDDGVRLRVQRLGPLADRMLDRSDVKVARAGPLTVDVADLSVDLQRLRAGELPDLRALAGRIHVEAGPSAGTMPLPSQPVARWEVDPVRLDLDARDLARGVALKAATALKLNGENAGVINVDLTASNLLGAAGQASLTMPVVSGRALVQNVATEVAQPLAEQYGLNLPRGLGPRLDLTFTAASAPPKAGEQVATDLDVQVRSAGLAADAGITLQGRVVRGRDRPISISLKSPGALVGPAAMDGGVSISEAGYLRVTVADLLLPLDPEGGALLDRASAKVQVDSGGFELLPLPPRQPGQPRGALPPPAGPPVTVRAITLNVALAPGRAPVVDLRGAGSHKEANFFMRGHVEAPGMGTPQGPRPTGSIELGNVPTAMVMLLAGLTAEPGQRRDADQLDAATMMRELVGPSITLTMTAEHPSGSPAQDRDLALRVDSPGIKGNAAARMTAAAVDLRQLDFRALITPQLAARLADMLGPQLASRPSLDGPATVRLTATPLTIPMKGSVPVLAGAGPATIKLEVPGRTLIRDIAFVQKEGPPRQVGPLGVEDLFLTLTTSMGVLAGDPAKPLPSELKLGGRALGPAGAFAEITGQGKVAMLGLRPVNDLVASIDLNISDSRALDAILDQHGLLTDAFGDRARLRAGLTVQYPQPDALPTAKGMPPDPVQPWTAQYVRADLNTRIDSPKVATAQPLQVVVLQDRLVIDKPMVMRWRMEPSWANWYLLAAGAVQEGQAEQVRFTEAAEWTLSIYKLTLSMGKNAGLMQPDIFALDINLETPGATMSVAGHPATFRDMRTRITAGREAGALGFAVRIRDAGGGAPPEGQAVDLHGAIHGLADAAGRLTADRALISAEGAAVGFPMPIVDAVAGQDGLITEALGPMANLQLAAQSLSRTGGNLDLTMTSERAEARVKGTVHEGRFIADGPGRAELKAITPELGQRMIKGIPILGAFEKRPGQAPAVLTAVKLTAPIDGDMAKLSGQVTFDPGEASFAASTLFGRFLKAGGQREAGTIGRRLQPITITITRGVASYQRFALPLGEFTIDTSGSVDLVSRRVDLVTYVPFGALTDEAAGIFNTGLGSLLGSAIPTIERATMVPIRITGPFDNTSVRPDPGLFVQNLGSSLRPDRLIGGTIKDIFDRIRPPDPKNAPAPEQSPRPEP